MNNYDYPMGADTSDAPWNERENKPQKFNIFVEYSLTKDNVGVETSDYGFEVYRDDDGECLVPDTSVTNWENAYHEDHFTIAEMLDELKKYIEKELPTLPKRSQRRYDLVRMLRDCQGWKEEIVDIGIF